MSESTIRYVPQYRFKSNDGPWISINVPVIDINDAKEMIHPRHRLPGYEYRVAKVVTTWEAVG